MRFGYFDDARREYVITTPRTPLPWINYLGSEAFFTLCSNTAGGYAFYRDARLRRLTRYRYNNCPLDSEGFRIYIKDGESVWNPGWQPVQTGLDRYECRHGLGYTVIEGEKDGVAVSQELLVPQGDDCLLMRVTVRNDGKTAKELRLFPYVEFCLWDAMDDGSNFQRNYSTGEVEVCGAAIYHKTEYRERRDHYATRPSTASGATTTPSSGPIGSPTASIPPARPSSASTAARRGRRPSSAKAARAAWPTAGSRSRPSNSTFPSPPARARPSSSAWAISKTRGTKNGPLPAS